MALPALWAGDEPPRIVSTLIVSLLEMLRLGGAKKIDELAHGSAPPFVVPLGLATHSSAPLGRTRSAHGSPPTSTLQRSGRHRPDIFFCG